MLEKEPSPSKRPGLSQQSRQGCPSAASEPEAAAPTVTGNEKELLA